MTSPFTSGSKRRALIRRCTKTRTRTIARRARYARRDARAHFVARAATALRTVGARCLAPHGGPGRAWCRRDPVRDGGQRHAGPAGCRLPAATRRGSIARPEGVRGASRCSRKRAMLATQADMDSIDAYYRTVAPFYAAEMRSRDDLADWKALARRLDAKRILDLGCGS